MSSVEQYNVRENREVGYEQKETTEKEITPEAKAAANMERADYLVKEVKQTKQQMQNIFLHMQQVLKTINDLRQQLALAQNGEEPASVKQSKQRIVQLKKKIADHREELLQMKDDLIGEQAKQLREQGYTDKSEQEIVAMASDMVDNMLQHAE